MRIVSPNLALIFCLSSQAETLTSDAFGMFQGRDDERSQWAGEHRICDAQGCKSSSLANAELHNIAEFFGEKSLTVGSGIGMSLGLFHDVNGNLIRDGIAQAWVEEGDQNQTINVKDGVATGTFTVGTNAGLHIASITSDGKQSVRQTFRTVPDLSSVELGIETTGEDARAGDVFRFTTKPLTDQYGNPAPIGFMTWLLMKNEQGEHAFFPMISQYKNATDMINTTSMRGDYRYQLFSSYQSSDTYTLTVVPRRLTSIQDIEVDLELSTNVMFTQIHGLTTDQNHLVEDATQIEVTVHEANGLQSTYQLWSLDGNVEGRFAIHPGAFPVKLTINSDLGNLEREISESDVRRVQ